MRRVTLVLLCNDKNQILLGMKKRGFGAGKRNGFGGKPDGDETILQTAVRELEEESGVVVQENQLEQLGLLHFIFDDRPDWSQDVYVFRGSYTGDFSETEEMCPQWRNIDSIPYEKMWEDDLFRLPKLIEKRSFEMTFHFDGNGKIVQK